MNHFITNLIHVIHGNIIRDCGVLLLLAVAVPKGNPMSLRKFVLFNIWFKFSRFLTFLTLTFF